MSSLESHRDWLQELDEARKDERIADERCVKILGSFENAHMAATWDNGARALLRKLFQARRSRSEIEQIIERRRSNGGVP